MRFFIYALLLFSTHSGFSQAIFSGGVLKPEQANMDVRHYTVALAVDPREQSIDGYTVIDVVLAQPTTTLLFDLLNTFKVGKVWVNNKEQPFKHEQDLIYITLAAAAAGKATVKIQYAGKPRVAVRPPWDGGFQWTKDSTGNDWIAISCQNEGAKIFFPCKDHPSDEPNEGADLIITVPKGLVVAGPGLLQKVTTKKSTATYHWKTNYTINNYSILFNAGKYKVVSRPYTTVNDNTVPIEFYVLEEHADKAPHHLDVFQRTIRMQEKYFGEYSWVKEKIGIAETPHLGMEHQSLNAYGNKFKYSQVGGQDFDWLMHHEFGHEWWGNKVTGKDWGDMWVQEGICSFGDALFTRDAEGEEAYIRRMQGTARGTQNQKPVVLGTNINSDDAYHGDIYGKGAFFMHTLRYVLGDEVFFPTLKKFATDARYTYDNLVTTDDVEQFFSRESNTELKPLFDFYLRTIKKLEVQVARTGDSTWHIKLLNYDGALPLDITIGDGVKRRMVDKKGIAVISKTTPLVGEKVFYLKRVIYE
ncbi:M1 family peptidase [Paraflavitalea soli]|uniref:Aminopeptidase N n=1 Tax=Paraflavitalea soli TaxID=2315862 RepID=A0A3B7MSB0_9BACT|nr:M1 family metallopeptidase [Paraflavitalea soli]AXY76737.1 M1 family peptidase [Paraflavitalea soli]